jgi:hypothetical protein
MPELSSEDRSVVAIPLFVVDDERVARAGGVRTGRVPRLENLTSRHHRLT